MPSFIAFLRGFVAVSVFVCCIQCGFIEKSKIILFSLSQLFRGCLTRLRRVSYLKRALLSSFAGERLSQLKSLDRFSHYDFIVFLLGSNGTSALGTFPTPPRHLRSIEISLDRSSANPSTEKSQRSERSPTTSAHNYKCVKDWEQRTNKECETA